MRRILLLLIVGALLILAVGCNGERTPPPSNVQLSPTSRPTSGPSATAVPGVASCQAVPSFFEGLPIQEGLPPVTDEDWSVGPEDALVTLIEYADFQ